MSGILKLFNTPMGAQLISGVARETGQPENKTADVLGMALPLLMGAMKKNIQSPQGAEGLLNALSSQHTGSILDDLSGLFGGGVDSSVKKEGAGILGHILGSKQPLVEKELSNRSGISPAAIADMLKIAAPILLGMLGRQRAQNNITNGADLNTVLGSLLGGQPRQNQDLITSLIDSDGDGSVLDDVSDIILGGSPGKQGGLGGLLGGLFGK
jgi:hypothetical protein